MGETQPQGCSVSLQIAFIQIILIKEKSRIISLKRLEYLGDKKYNIVRSGQQHLAVSTYCPDRT